jgi:hypothetical protein
LAHPVKSWISHRHPLAISPSIVYITWGRTDGDDTMQRYCLVIFFSLAAAAVSWGSETDLLRKFQSQNSAAADKLKQEVGQLLNSAGQDPEPLRKLLGQLHDDLFLPRDERTLLIRKVEDRLRDCKSLAEKKLAEPAAREPKISVKQAILVTPGRIAVNTGPMAAIVPDGGTRVLAGYSYLAEGRSEYGVPGLGGIPYLGRAFRNVSTSRISGSITISASVRISSMEEEEARFLAGR